MVAFVGNIISFTLKLHTKLLFNIPILRQSLVSRTVYVNYWIWIPVHDFDP